MEGYRGSEKHRIALGRILTLGLAVASSIAIASYLTSAHYPAYSFTDDESSKTHRVEQKSDFLQGVSTPTVIQNWSTVESSTSQSGHSQMAIRSFAEDGAILLKVNGSKSNQYELKIPARYVETNAFPLNLHRIQLDDGTPFNVIDYRTFIRADYLSGFVKAIRDNTDSDYDFLQELWYVSSQLSKYSPDVGEDPKFPLRTLIDGKGDCEDSTILLASMLRASPDAAAWKIELVYFDASSPSDPREINHVALLVRANDFQTFVETTSNSSGLNTWKSIDGWYYAA